ncbi:MAG: dienelactone hydrolase [bacterium]|nr:alpha/beta fold hydrolase [Acidimicrobiia bacterium]MCY4650154.1 dienelactone hydrolase [bacterium]
MELPTATVEWAPGREISVWMAGDRGEEFAMLLAHGAGSDALHPLTVGLRDELVKAGVWCVTFNYPYKEEGRRWPDSPERLLACHQAVLDWAVEQTGEMPVLAGRSMGGRISSYLAAEGAPVKALVLYAYPLHPPGRHDRLRSDHLGSISVPMLFFRGSRDVFSRSDLFDREVRNLETTTVVDLEGLDHLFRGRVRMAEIVNRSIAETTLAWLRSLPG